MAALHRPLSQSQISRVMSSAESFVIAVLVAPPPTPSPMCLVRQLLRRGIGAGCRYAADCAHTLDTLSLIPESPMWGRGDEKKCQRGSRYYGGGG